MVLQHFGLTQYPLGKAHTELWDDGVLARLGERFTWLLQTPGVGLLTGEAGVGKTAALRQLTQTLNPHRYPVIYLAETDFGRLDLYRSLALALGLGARLPPCRPVASDQGLHPGTGRRQRRHAAVDHRRGTQSARGVLP